jgi:hypothetical protein
MNLLFFVQINIFIQFFSFSAREQLRVTHMSHVHTRNTCLFKDIPLRTVCFLDAIAMNYLVNFRISKSWKLYYRGFPYVYSLSKAFLKL